MPDRAEQLKSKYEMNCATDGAAPKKWEQYLMNGAEVTQVS